MTRLQQTSPKVPTIITTTWKVLSTLWKRETESNIDLQDSGFMQVPKQKTCSKCKDKGHNSRTCKSHNSLTLTQELQYFMFSCIMVFIQLLVYYKCYFYLFMNTSLSFSNCDTVPSPHTNLNIKLYPLGTETSVGIPFWLMYYIIGLFLYT